MNAKLLLVVATIGLDWQQADARALDIFMGLHWCHCNVSAVHLDGNTSLFASQVWLPTTTSSTRFMRAWWENTDVSPPQGVTWTVWSANYGPTVYASVEEARDVDVSNYDIIITKLVTADSSGRAFVFVCSTPSGVIPRGLGYAFVMVALDASDGQCDYFVQQGRNKEGGQMIDWGTSTPGAVPWAGMTGWWIGGDINMNLQPIMDTAEASLDLDTKYAHNPLVDGTTAQLFTTPGGFARNLNHLSLTPQAPATHNCAGPTVGVIPAMCNRGNANAFPVGPEVAPGLDAYLMQVLGTLTTAPSDPCWFPDPAGEGCSGL